MSTSKVKSLWDSRRFWVAVAAVGAVVFQDKLGIDPEEVMKVIGIGVAWIVGDSVRKTE